MAKNVLRFPGYLHPDRNTYWHAGKRYKAFSDLLSELTEDEIAKMKTWHIKRGLGMGSRQAAMLVDPKMRQA
jgi:hypothetical protein